jgi:hypothetical protein
MPPETNHIPENILPNAEITLAESVNLYKEYMNTSSLAQNTLYCYTKDLETRQSNFGSINLSSIKMYQINQLIIKQKQSKTSHRGDSLEQKIFLIE